MRSRPLDILFSLPGAAGAPVTITVPPGRSGLRERASGAREETPRRRRKRVKTRRFTTCRVFPRQRPGRIRRGPSHPLPGVGRHGRPGPRRADHRGVRGARPHRLGGGTPVSADNAVGLVLAVGLIVFLVAALLLPEKF
nr:potassium-transporting ATPase subunit F [Actinomadura rayongensis]